MGEAKKKADAKKEMFEKNPEEFIHLSEAVMCVRMNDNGKLESFVNHEYGHNLQTALGILVCEVPFAMQFVKHQAATKEKSEIITPGDNGGINRMPK